MAHTGISDFSPRPMRQAPHATATTDTGLEVGRKCERHQLASASALQARGLDLLLSAKPDVLPGRSSGRCSDNTQAPFVPQEASEWPCGGGAPTPTSRNFARLRSGARQFLSNCVDSGQRTRSAMVYLNAVENGGATRFKTIGKTI